MRLERRACIVLLPQAHIHIPKPPLPSRNRLQVDRLLVCWFVGLLVCWFVGFATENSRMARPFHCHVAPWCPRTNGLKIKVNGRQGFLKV
jgi:hypothetical protein